MSDSPSPIFVSPGGDQEMEQAALKARQTFKYFWREVSWERRRIVPALDLAAVKATFSDPPEVRAQNPGGMEAEHMWLLEVDFDGKQIQGTLINSPHSLKSVREGDRVKISISQLCDWMYVVEGKVYGGFTVDLMRSRMKDHERMEHDQAWGFDFGEAGEVQLVPPGYIGESNGKKGLFSFFSKPKKSTQDFAKVAATEHPMSVNMRESLDQALTKDPQMIQHVDDNGFHILHQLSLAGSWDGVDVCLKHGADPGQVASNGMTPLALAKSLDWTRVVELLEKTGAK